MIEIREVIALTALSFGLTPSELLAENRRQNVVLARQVAIYVARKHTGHATTAIGTAFAGRDHTTVLYAIERIETELRAAPHGQLAALIRAIERNVEFRERIEALGGVDVLTVARRIAAHPVNRAMAASVMEVAALAAPVVDLWEIALAGEALADAVAVEAPGFDDTRLAAALSRSIREEMAALRGETNTDEQETYNG